MQYKGIKCINSVAVELKHEVWQIKPLLFPFYLRTLWTDKRDNSAMFAPPKHKRCKQRTRHECGALSCSTNVASVGRRTLGTTLVKWLNDRPTSHYGGEPYSKGHQMWYDAALRFLAPCLLTCGGRAVSQWREWNDCLRDKRARLGPRQDKNVSLGATPSATLMVLRVSELAVAFSKHQYFHTVRQH
jgi:hypothetical protein